MFDFLYKAPRGRHDIVKRTVEDEGEEYIKRIYALPNRFYLSFFEECINSSVADAYEYFAEIRVWRKRICNDKGKGQEVFKINGCSSFH